MSPVYFYNKFKHLPSDALILEIGPHGLFSQVVKETLESGTYVSLIKKDSNDTNLDMFLASIAKLYELGLNPLIENLYPPIQWPVARSTQSISSLLKWDHEYNNLVRKYPDYHFRSYASDMNEVYNPSQSMKAFMPEHCIDGNVLYPATGYLMLAWRRMAAQHGKLWNQLPAIFEDVQFRRPIFLSDTDMTRIKVRYIETSGEFTILESGEFTILESGNITCVGRVRTSDEYALNLQHVLVDTEAHMDEEFAVNLTTTDIYKDLKILGYDYGPKFRRIRSMKTNDFETMNGQISWDGNWVTFMDSLLQTMVAGMPFRKMMVPVMIRSIRCDPKAMYEGIAAHKTAEHREREFTILESGNITCVGRVRTSDEYALNLQHVLVDTEAHMDEEFAVNLTTTDIYKDLKILGYDYGPKFRRIRSMKTNDFETMNGQISWDGNWVTFMDSLLQTMVAGMPFRKMMVPVMIRSIRCDPKAMYEGIAAHKTAEHRERRAVLDYVMDDENLNVIALSGGDKALNEGEVEGILSTYNVDYMEELFGQEFHVYPSVLPFHVDINSRMIVTYGVEIEDLMASPIARKSNMQDLKLESYQFVANEENIAIEEYDKKSMTEYLKICSLIGNKIKKLNESKDKKVIQNMTNNLVNKYLNDMKDNYILLKILNQVYKESLDENQNINTNKVITDLQNNREYDLSLDYINEVSKNEHLIRSLVDIVSECFIPKKEIKVLELNLTNGLMAKEVDTQLASSHIYPIDVNYTIAVKSVGAVSDSYKNQSFKLIEWNPQNNVFPTEINSTNFILLKDSNDLWDIDLDTQLQDMFDVISDKGFLLSVFRYQLTEPELALNQINGKKALKNSDLEKRIIDFIKAAQSVGFNVIGRKLDTIGSMAILYRKLFCEPKVPKNDNIIQMTSNAEKWFETLKEKIIEQKENESNETLWLIANDSSNNGIIGLINCLRLEPGGECLRCVFDCDNLIEGCVKFTEKPYSDILANDLPINVLKNGKVGTYRHFTLGKSHEKIESNDYFLNVGHNRDLASLQWYDSRNLVTNKDDYDLINTKTNKTACHIYSAGMNFRDVMFATGRIGSGPQTLFTDCLIGFEFAGRRADTGERVCGFDMSRCYATSIDANEELISRIPDKWSMDDAVSVLSTYSTVWYGLIERAHMQKGESILIHSGAGGVGQAAISICQFYECDIFVTIGTEEKKKFLMNTYNIAENRILSSRNTQFKYKIKEMTRGKGVDVVLNSLTGDKLDASYECIADCGRFVEIGKYDLQMNKQLGMFPFLRDISFIGVSVDQKLYTKRGFVMRFFEWMHQNCDNGMIKPINQNVFKAEEAEKAFRFMTTGKHIGKIVIRIRDEESDKNAKSAFNPSNKLLVTRKTYFNPNKTYIITGGLGGFGLEFIHWMTFLGARRFVLTSRFGVKTDYQKFILKRLASLGANLKQFATKVVVLTHDCYTTEGTNKLLAEAHNLGPIGGVFHLALVLNDSLLENQTFDKFQETIDSKTKVFENLDKMSRELSIDLDYFVVFSSVSCGKGNAGQSNYGFANSVCERICESRRRDGLHGLAIQWGPIGDVGVLADSEINTSLAAIVKQRVNSCLEILDKLLQSDNSIVSCLVRAKRSVMTGTKESKLVNQVWVALGIDPKTTPNHLTLGEIGMESMFAVELQQGLERENDERLTLGEIGMESMFAVELQQGLEREYDIRVTLNDIKNITIGMMKDFEIGKADEMKKFADEIKSCRTKLCKVKFIIPSDACIKLNNVTTGKPLYFFPPLEGIFTSLEGLTEKIDRPVIGLNWTRDMEKLGSLKEITKYYIQLLKALEPKGDYDIFGHFYGALIAMKMLKKAPIGKAIIIDMLSEVTLDEDMISDDNLVEIILSFCTKDLPTGLEGKLNFETIESTNTQDLEAHKTIERMAATINQYLRKR
ncbi:unnamed protein product, partial [Medioppia subpectinata]